MDAGLKSYLGRLEVRGSLSTALTGVHGVAEEVRAGGLFVALREPPDFDGHDDLQQAAALGAGAVLVDRRGVAAAAELAVPTYVVDSTTVAWGELAKIYRRESIRYPIVAITGSAGKTSTKDLTAAALGAVKTNGNRNNLHGAPYTLLGFPRDATAGVVELGSSQPGEIGKLSEIVQPDVGVITNIGHAHLEGLRSLEGVAAEKGALLASLHGDGVAVVNADDAMTQTQLDRFSGREVISFSGGPNRCATVYVDSIGPVGEHEIDAEVMIAQQRRRLRLAHPAVHGLANAVAALAVVLALEADVEAALVALASARLTEGRFELYPLAGRLLIDDTYNANPESVRAAVDSMLRRAGARPSILCLGDMAELGLDTRRLHFELGSWLAGSDLTHLYTIGEQCLLVATAAERSGMKRVEHFVSREKLSAAVCHAAHTGSVILVKGSRSARMERVVDRLWDHWSSGPMVRAGRLEERGCQQGRPV